MGRTGGLYCSDRHVKARAEVLAQAQTRSFPSCFSDMVWNPRAVKVDNVYLSGYDDEWDQLLGALPKIPEYEAALLYDLLSKIFVYDLARCPIAREMLNYPWFYLAGP